MDDVTIKLKNNLNT